MSAWLNRWSFFAVLAVVTGAVAAFAINTFGWRDSPEALSRTDRAERARVASVLYNNLIKDFTGYIDRIDGYLPGQYLVRVGTEEHPSVRVCYLVNLEKFRRSHDFANLPCDLGTRK